MKIAITEDHADLREMICDCLRRQGHDVVATACADDLDDHLAQADVDLLILDLNLPGEQGFSVAERLRATHPALIIIMVTARTGLEDRIRGYASGADIYLAKPIEPRELIAAVSNVERRLEAMRTQQTQLTLSSTTLQLIGPQGSTSLTPPEVLLLKSLAEAPGRQLEYWRLEELLLLESTDKSKGALEVRVSRLKKKLRNVGAPDPTIKSLWKAGYRLCPRLRIVDH